MKVISDEELKERSINILAHIDEICRKNHIQYSIAYGTLLGAVRHNGFIPWDDDVDIVLVRKEYDRLIKILANDAKYSLFSFETKKEWRYYFAKLVDPKTQLVSFEKYGEDPELGVFVDIFPLDNLPDDASARQKYALKGAQLESEMELTMKLAYARSTKPLHAIAKRILKYPKHLQAVKKADYGKRREIFDQHLRQYNHLDTQYCGLFNEVNNLFPQSMFTEFESIPFENISVQAIKEREKFLQIEYGDYLKLPPEAERVTHHPYTAYEKY